MVHSVIEWVNAEIGSLAALLASIEFSRWHVFIKEKQHFAVLVPADKEEWADIDSEERSNPIVEARQIFLLRMFRAFGCTTEPVLLEAWLYRDASGDPLFRCSLYNRPGVWYPHVTIAVKFTHLSEPALLAWPAAVARIKPDDIYFEILKK